MTTGESSKLTNLPTISDPKPTGVYLYGVDTLNTTVQQPGGTSGKTYFSTLYDNMIPSASELSEPGRLNSYINYCWSKNGHCKLPNGIITLPNDETIVFEKDHACTLEGANISYAGVNSSGGWITQTNPTGHTIIRKSAGTSPIFQTQGCLYLTFKNFTIENPGNDCFLFSRIDFGPSGFFTFDHVGGVNSRRVFYANPQGNYAADMVFKTCHFENCDIVLETNHLQSVNWVFTDQCYFLNIDIAVFIRHGGHVIMDGCCGYSTTTWVRADRGGPNLMPTVMIRKLYSDRDISDNVPVIVDFSRADAHVAAIVDGFTINTSSDDNIPYSGHPLFLTATGTLGKTYFDRPPGTLRSGIEIRNPDFSRTNSLFNNVPTATGNPYGDQGYAKRTYISGE